MSYGRRAVAWQESDGTRAWDGWVVDVVHENDRLKARLAAAENALREIAGTDPNVDGIHWVGDELNPELCPGCIAAKALSDA